MLYKEITYNDLTILSKKGSSLDRELLVNILISKFPNLEIINGSFYDFIIYYKGLECYINLIKDDYVTVVLSNKKYYLCDQVEGLIELIEFLFEKYFKSKNV